MDKCSLCPVAGDCIGQIQLHRSMCKLAEGDSIQKRAIIDRSALIDGTFQPEISKCGEVHEPTQPEPRTGPVLVGTAKGCGCSGGSGGSLEERQAALQERVLARQAALQERVLARQAEGRGTDLP